MSRSHWNRLLAGGVLVALLLFAAPQAEACRGCGWGGGWGGYYGGWGGYYGGWGGYYGGGCCGYGSGGYYAPYYSGCSSCSGCYASYGNYSSGACSSCQPAAPSSPTPKSTGISTEGGWLTVLVPSDAKVIINGLETRSTGSRRQFYSLGLKPGLTYAYVVRAEVIRNGQVQEDTQSVRLTVGQSTAVAFRFNATPQQVATNP